MLNNSDFSNIAASPKITRKTNLSILNNIYSYNMNNMTNKIYRINKDDKYLYKFKDKNDNIFGFENIYQNKNIRISDSNNNYKRIKSLNHNQNINANNYKRLNSAIQLGFR